jgi:hypothetical protein
VKSQDLRITVNVMDINYGGGRSATCVTASFGVTCLEYSYCFYSTLYVYTYVCMYVCTHMYVCKHMYLCMHAYVCMYI